MMNNVLPATTGLTVDGVIYQYTTVKNPADLMKVTVQNRNALDPNNYIFRSTDDWTGLRGTTINKVIPVNNIEGRYWGNGEIAIDGKGEVKDASVFYKYRFDTCVADVLSDPSCPGYAEALLKKLSLKSAEPIDPLSDEFVRRALDNKTVIEEDRTRNNARPEQRERNRRNDREDAKKAASPLVSSEDAQRAAQFEMLNNIPGFNLYTVSMPGGTYNDVIRYPEKRLPDNRSGRILGIAQDRLHKSMVDSQYDK